MDKLRTVELYRDDQCRLIAIESVEFNHAKSKHSYQLYGSLIPIAIVVCTPEANEIFPVDDDITKPDKLRQSIPELDELITNAC